MAASQSEMNVYVPAHQLRMKGDGTYLWVKWWREDNTYYAHFHRAGLGESFVLHSLGRNGKTICEKEEANLDDLHEGLLEALRARYDIADYAGGSR
ncbi:hypothetical protein ABSL23_17400 (plasmid) [Halobacterium sp. NMX12-1]|uniref:Uncharacterized protein n=1 Tax=Halobacterium sp. NMX12-1 TaxID=3166650 RepID=A0AAU8CHK9_9EURY